MVIKFLLTGGKFMSEMHLRQPAALSKPGLTYSACNTKIQRNRRFMIFLSKRTR